MGNIGSAVMGPPPPMSWTSFSIEMLKSTSRNTVSSIYDTDIIGMWTPAYAPGDGQTSRVYSSNPVLHLYISWYVTVNKPVLSNLLLRLLPQAHNIYKKLILLGKFCTKMKQMNSQAVNIHYKCFT